MLANRATSTSTPSHPAFAAALQRAWSMLALFAFVALVCTAMWHHHETLVQEQDCLVCSMVLHKVVELPASPVPLLMPMVVAYTLLFVSATPDLISAPALVLPPSCGPPQVN